MSLSFTAQKLDSQFNYSKDSLADLWSRVHSIDKEPWPTADRLKVLLAGRPIEAASPHFKDDFDSLAECFQQAWVDFHNGDFQAAFENAERCGPVAAYASLLAVNTYACYLAPQSDREKLYAEAAERAKQAIQLFPNEVNIEYAYALNIGRYSEEVSMAKALSSGAAISFKKSIEKCLGMQPNHLPSLLALATLHAQAIDAIGELAARMTFGATRKKVLSVYEEAVKMDKPAPLIYVEYGKNILLLDKKNKRLAEKMLRLALEVEVLDPLDILDQKEAEKLLANL